MYNNNNCHFPDMPEFCPSPAPKPCPNMPPVPSVVSGDSLFEVVQNLTDKVNVCISTYNDVMCQNYKTLHNLERAAQSNGAYYGDCEVWTEQGYLADESCSFSLIHKACVDRRGEPIKMQLHLAYGNTTNSKITQSIFSASQIDYADKIVTAIPISDNGWYGNPILNGAPIATSAAPTLYTVGFTRNGVMRVYSNGASVDQMLRDTIENAMGCSGVLIQNSALTDESWHTSIPDYDKQVERVIMGQNLDTREVIFLVTGNENNVNHRGITSMGAAKILLQYGCDIAVELSESNNAGACDKGALMFVPKDNKIPVSYAYWFISRKCFYCNDYERELAMLMQRYGQNLWEQYLTAGNVADIRAKLEQEILDRVSGDNLLQTNITAEELARKLADEILQQNIDNEVLRAEAAEKILQGNINAEQARAEAAENVLQNNINAEQARAEAAENVLQNNINAEQARAEAAENVLDNKKVNRAGDTITGDLNIVNADVGVDGGSVIVSNADGDSSVMTANSLKIDTILEVDNQSIRVGDKQIKNVSDPTLAQDVSTKNYVDQTISQEVTARENADIALGVRITSESEARATADNVEKAARIAADNALGERIDTETLNRIAADTQLQTNITVEATTRDTADKLLQSNIDTEAEARREADRQLKADIELESTERANDIAGVTTQINTEVTARTNADGALSTAITSEATARIEANTMLNTKLNEEITERIAVDDTKLNLSGGTMTGQLLLSGNVIAENQAATKKYVDDLTGGGAGYLPLTGGTMIGNLVLNGVPAQENQAATKGYIDSNFVSKSGKNTVTSAVVIDIADPEEDGIQVTSETVPVINTGISPYGVSVGTGLTRTTLSLNTLDFRSNLGVVGGLKLPELSDHATSKEYVDTLVTNEANTRVAEDAKLLPLTGGTLTGGLSVEERLTITGTVDPLLLIGNTVIRSDSVHFSSLAGTVEGLAAPMLPHQAVNKAYADGVRKTYSSSLTTGLGASIVGTYVNNAVKALSATVSFSSNISLPANSYKIIGEYNGGVISGSGVFICPCLKVSDNTPLVGVHCIVNVTAGKVKCTMVNNQNSTVTIGSPEFCSGSAFLI